VLGVEVLGAAAGAGVEAGAAGVESVLAAGALAAVEVGSEPELESEDDSLLLAA
jgi:hypothetical protein